eukprot:9487366-Pyramimonas_sp.AAC.1
MGRPPPSKRMGGGKPPNSQAGKERSTRSQTALTVHRWRHPCGILYAIRATSGANHGAASSKANGAPRAVPATDVAQPIAPLLARTIPATMVHLWRNLRNDDR